MRIGFNKSRMLYKYLISFSIVLLIPLVFFIYMINNRILPTLRNQVINANRENLQKAREQIERKFGEMEKIALNISVNPRLLPYMIRQNYYKAYEGIVELMSYKNANDFIYDVLYYIRGDERIYGAYQSWELKLMMEKIYPFEKWTYDQLYEDINSLGVPAIRPLEKCIDPTVGSFEVIPYIYPVRPYEPYASVIFLIDNEKLKDMLDSILQEYNENIYVLDKNNRVVTSLKREDTLEDKQFRYIVDMISSHEENTFMLPGEKYLVSHIKSEKNHWTYISVVRNNRIMARVNDMKAEVYFSILTIFLLGTILITISTYINYTPFFKLQKKITEKFVIKDGEKNEVERMSRVFDEILMANERLKGDVERYKPILREYVLKELIRGNVTGMDEMVEIQRAVELYSSNTMLYQVVIFKFTSSDSNWNCTLGNKFVHKMLEGYLEKQAKVYSINNWEEDCLILVLAFHKDFEKQMADGMRSILKDIMDKTSKEWNVDINIGVGNTYDDILSLGQSFTEATTVLHRHLFENEKSVYIFNQSGIGKPCAREDYTYPYGDLKRLSAQINYGKLEKVRRTLQKLMRAISEGNIPGFFVRCIIFDIYNMLIKKAVEMNIDLGAVIGEYMDVFASEDPERVGKLYGLLGIACEEICSQITGKQVNNNHLMNQIMDYIDENYDRYEFSLERMAEHLNISSTYLSHIFKAMTGDTVLEYIWNMRATRAKELLVSSELPVKDIVKSIGYINGSSFIRKFRAKEGMTPGEYRKQYNDGG